MNEAQALQNITACAKGKGITLTQKLFYIHLLRYAEKNGERVDEGLRVCVSEKEMSRAFSISPRMVTKTLRILSENGIILRQDNPEGGFPRKPSYTTLLSEFYE